MVTVGESKAKVNSTRGQVVGQFENSLKMDAKMPSNNIYRDRIPIPKFRRYTPRRKKSPIRKAVNAMTLAASIRTEHGVILCAESQITEGQAKFNESKLSSFNWTPALGFASVGAGFWDYVKMAYEDLQTALLKHPDGEDVSQTIKTVVTNIYANQIAAHPGSGVYEKPNVSLLTAVIQRGVPFPFVIKSVDTAVHAANAFDAIGIGQDLAKYIGSKLYQDDFSEDQGAALAAYILEEAKQNVEGCGGVSQIIWIGKTGLRRVPTAKLAQLRAWFNTSDQRIPNLSKLPAGISPVFQTDISL
jgi:20S proteasome alpha/beta subunit